MARVEFALTLLDHDNLKAADAGMRPYSPWSTTSRIVMRKGTPSRDTVLAALHAMVPKGRVKRVWMGAGYLWALPEALEREEERKEQR